MNASRLFVALAAAACTAPVLAAQTVQGRFVDAAGQPVPGGRAVLRDARGREVATGMTGRDGTFVLRARDGGRYSIAIERTGFGLSLAPPFALRDGQTMQKDVTASAERIALQTLSANPRCTPHPAPGTEAALVWEEARKALGGARDNEAAAYQYGVRRFWRQLDAEGRTIVLDSVAPAEVTAGNPFVSSPAERVAETGFVENVGSDRVFHVPDAGILLSAVFQDAHCFGLREGEAGLIGLAFAPVADGEKSDVEGTMWIDRASAELRQVEYRYTHVAGMGQPNDAAGGRMEFRRLEDGRWIVSRWRIRMPVIVAQEMAGAVRVPELDGGSDHLQYRLAAQLEQGGDVLSVTPAGGARIDLASAGMVHGVVYDSTQLQPLAGARVTLAGSHATLTDAEGRFTIHDVPAGDYILAFSSPRLDTMRFVPPAARVSVREGAATERALTVPPLAAVWASACADSGQAPGRGVLVGRVNSAGGEARPFARVTVSWLEEGTSSPHAVRLATDVQGIYRFCSAPAGPPLTVRVDASPSTLTVTDLHVAQGRALRQDVGLPATLALAANGRSAAAQSTLSGIVRGAAGQALAGATVRFGDQPAVTTDGQGRFRMRMLPPREYAVSVSHPELGTRTTTVALTADAGEVELRPRAGESSALVATVQRVVQLAALQAQARNMTLDIHGFYDRQHHGQGIFITEERLQRNRAGKLTDVLRGIPGIRVLRYVPTDTSTTRQRAVLVTSGLNIDEQYRIASSRGSTRIMDSGPCWMDVYLDGVQVQSWNPALSQSLDSFPLSSVQAVEVYRGPAETPEQYKQAWSACGVVLLWTKG